MGYYIQGPTTGKAPFLVSEYDAKIIPQPKSFSEIPGDKALIVVVKNPLFEAAGYCFDEKEFEDFSYPDDIRPKKWLIMDKKRAQELSGFEENK